MNLDTNKIDDLLRDAEGIPLEEKYGSVEDMVKKKYKDFIDPNENIEIDEDLLPF